MLQKTKQYRQYDPLKPRAPKKQLGANVSNWTNERLEAVLADSRYMGVDGKDYGPIAHLLRDEWLRRYSTRHERQLKQDDKDWREFEDYASSRKEKLKVIIGELRRKGGLTYQLALDLKREIEFLTGLETCPFAWAIYETNNAQPEK